MNFGLDPNRWETTNLGASTRCSVQLYAWQASAPSCTSHSAGCLGFSTLRATLNASVPNSGSYTWAVPRAFHSEYDWADAPVSILTLLNCKTPYWNLTGTGLSRRWWGTSLSQVHLQASDDTLYTATEIPVNGLAAGAGRLRVFARVADGVRSRLPGGQALPPTSPSPSP